MSVTKNTQKIYNFWQKGDFQAAYILAESVYNDNTTSITALEDYVKMMFHISRDNEESSLEDSELAKIKDVLDSFPCNTSKNLKILDLYNDLYCITGDIDLIKKNNKKIFDIIPDENMRIKDISSISDDDIRPDQKYFRNQLFDLIDLLINKYSSKDKLLKEAYNRLRDNMVSDAYYKIKLFAQGLSNKEMKIFILGELDLAEEKLDKARRRYLSIVDTFSDNWIVWNRLGDIHLAKGNNNKALDNYLKAQELNPNDIDTNLDLIRTYVLQGDIKKAKSLYIKSTDKFGNEKTSALKKYISKKVRKKSVTTVNGLASFQTKDENSSGSVLEIDFHKSKQQGSSLIPLGHLGLSMINSIKTAEVVVQEHLLEKFDTNINVNVPHVVRSYDGPSAGIGFVLGSIACLTEKIVPSTSSFTGAIGVSGKIMGVGGVKEKVTASYICGMKDVYIPKSNFSDLSFVDSKIKMSLNIILVSHYMDILEKLWN